MTTLNTAVWMLLFATAGAASVWFWRSGTLASYTISLFCVAMVVGYTAMLVARTLQ